MSSSSNNTPTAINVKPLEERVMKWPKCKSDIELEKPDPKTKLFASSGTKTPYCPHCWFDSEIRQNPAGLVVSGGERSN